MINLAELKAELDIPEQVVIHDASLLRMEAAAVEFAQAHTRAYLGPPAPQVETFDGGGPALWLSTVPTEFDRVEQRNGATWETVDADTYYVEGREVVRVCGDDWPRGRSHLRAHFSAGYDDDNPAPELLRDTIIALVAFRFRTKGREGLESEKIGDYSYKLADVAAVRVPGGVTVKSALDSMRVKCWLG